MVIPTREEVDKLYASHKVREADKFGEAVKDFEEFRNSVSSKAVLTDDELDHLLNWSDYLYSNSQFDSSSDLAWEAVTLVLSKADKNSVQYQSGLVRAWINLELFDKEDISRVEYLSKLTTQFRAESFGEGNLETVLKQVRDMSNSGVSIPSSMVDFAAAAREVFPDGEERTLPTIVEAQIVLSHQESSHRDGSQLDRAIEHLEEAVSIEVPLYEQLDKPLREKLKEGKELPKKDVLRTIYHRDVCESLSELLTKTCLLKMSILGEEPQAAVNFLGKRESLDFLSQVPADKLALFGEEVISVARKAGSQEVTSKWLNKIENCLSDPDKGDPALLKSFRENRVKTRQPSPKESAPLQHKSIPELAERHHPWSNLGI